MAQKVLVQLLDDVDGSEATQTIGFGLDGQAYEIDLNDTHAEELRAAVDKFVNAARRMGGKARVVRPRPSQGKSLPAQSERRVELPASQETIRAWARANGYTVGDKGRIAAKILQAFSEANPT